MPAPPHAPRPAHGPTLPHLQCRDVACRLLRARRGRGRGQPLALPGGGYQQRVRRSLAALGAAVGALRAEVLVHAPGAHVVGRCLAAAACVAGSQAAKQHRGAMAPEFPPDWLI
jgi:hypothetical protein